MFLNVDTNDPVEKDQNLFPGLGVLVECLILIYEVFILDHCSFKAGNLIITKISLEAFSPLSSHSILYAF